MFQFMVIVSIVFTVYKIIKEKNMPKAPKGTRFDWDRYNEDIKSGMTCMEQLKKTEHGDYYTTNPLHEKKEIIPKVVDMVRYQHDKELYGEEIAETFRKNGSYMHVRK